MIQGEDTNTDGCANQDIAQAEFFRYRAEQPIPVTENRLKWWQSRSCMYPNMAKVARKYLCVVKTSVPSEQLFSTAGNVVSVKRGVLLPENVEKLVFLHDNLPPVDMHVNEHCSCEECKRHKDIIET